MLSPNHRVRIVDSAEALFATPFGGDVNALCWPRRLAGDFQALLAQLPVEPGITTIDDDDLRSLTLSPAAAAARDALLADQELLRRHGLAPNLDVISGYQRDTTDAVIATDVFSFHVDRSPIPADTILCTYAGAASEGVANEWAVRKVDVPDTRAELLRRYGGADDAGFASYLEHHSFDLHYDLLPGAEIFSFALCNLWRIAIAYPGSPVPPCIHRAPITQPGDPARLLLIS